MGGRRSALALSGCEPGVERGGEGERLACPSPNMSLELTPSVRALQCLMTSVGIGSSIESTWERSSAPIR